MTYLIAYDIADPRRLRRIARRLERRAIRIQKSVYRFEGDESAVRNVLAELRPLLDPKADVLAAWRLTGGAVRNAALHLGVRQPGPVPAAIIARGQLHLIEESES